MPQRILMDPRKGKQVEMLLLIQVMRLPCGHRLELFQKRAGFRYGKALHGGAHDAGGGFGDGAAPAHEPHLGQAIAFDDEVHGVFVAATGVVMVSFLGKGLQYRVVARLLIVVADQLHADVKVQFHRGRRLRLSNLGKLVQFRGKRQGFAGSTTNHIGMQQLLNEMEAWRQAGKRFVLARVLATWGSAPRQPGAAMLIASDGKVAGSVSSGCVESDLIAKALRVLETGQAQRIEYGVPDEKAWSVGLSCGGQLTVWAEPFWGDAAPEVWAALLAQDTRNGAGMLVSRLEAAAEPPIYYDVDYVPVGNGGLALPLLQAAVSDWRAGQSGVVTLDGVEHFVQRFRPRSRVIVLGAGHIAVSLVRYLDVLGLETLVIDPRALFTDADRFGNTRATILTAWPQEVMPDMTFGEGDFIVLLTHDPRIDDPAIQMVLRKPVAYIGALGSQKSHAKRRERLLAAGFTEAEIDRIHAPIGLKLGGVGPEEIALSIAAEIVKVKSEK
jgi:xanthine dehydrogenase accessory factor